MRKLTRREIQTIKCICNGMTNFQIGQFLGISEKTVKFYVTNIHKKAALTSRLQIALYFKGKI